MGYRLRAPQIGQCILSEPKQVLQVGCCLIQVLLGQFGKVRLPFAAQLEYQLFLPSDVKARRLDHPYQQFQIYDQSRWCLH